MTTIPLRITPGPEDVEALARERRHLDGLLYRHALREERIIAGNASDATIDAVFHNRHLSRVLAGPKGW